MSELQREIMAVKMVRRLRPEDKTSGQAAAQLAHDLQVAVDGAEEQLLRATEVAISNGNYGKQWRKPNMLYNRILDVDGGFICISGI
jgi:hypothetical protein